MAAWRRWAACLTLAWSLGACAELRADRPLFSVTDQGAAPVLEGIWIAISDDCPERHIGTRGRFPAACRPIEIRRVEDGAWRYTPRVDLAYGLSAEDRAQANQELRPLRFVLVPVVERTLPPDHFASLYVAETQAADEAHVAYAVVAPLGALPSGAALVLASIGCIDILRDGPIEGVTAHYAAAEPGVDATEPAEGSQTEPALTGCTVSTPAAVREAARRAVLENLEEMTAARLVRVRP